MVLCICLALVTVALYEPVVHNGYTNFDDIYYILKNPRVQAGLTSDTVKWAFTKFYLSNWHPLTWLSHAVDCQIFNSIPQDLRNGNAELAVSDFSCHEARTERPKFSTACASSSTGWPHA